MIYSLIAFLIALIPFCVWSSLPDGIRTPKEIASILGLIGICWAGSLYEKHKLTIKPLFLFWLWCFAVTIINSYNIPILFANSGGGVIAFAADGKAGPLTTPIQLYAWKELFYITLSVFCIYTIASVKTSPHYGRFFGSHLLSGNSTPKEYIGIISRTIVWVSVITCIYALIQAIGLDNFFKVTNNTGMVAETNTKDFGLTWHVSHRIVSTIGNPTLLGAFLALCLPFTLYDKSKLAKLALVLIVCVLVFAQGTTGIVASIVGILFYLLFKNRKLFIALLAVLMITGFVVSKKIDIKDFINPTGRIEVHKVAWDMVKDRPLLGMGLGTFEWLVGNNPETFKKLDECKWKELHDEYGQIWFSTGLVGLGLFLWFISYCFVKFWRARNDESIVIASALIAFLVCCITLFPMRIAPHAFYGVILTGLLLNVTRRTE